MASAQWACCCGGTPCPTAHQCDVFCVGDLVLSITRGNGCFAEGDYPLTRVTGSLLAEWTNPSFKLRCTSDGFWELDFPFSHFPVFGDTLFQSDLPSSPCPYLGSYSYSGGGDDERCAMEDYMLVEMNVHV